MSVDVYVDNTVTTRIPPRLIESDIHGKGAAEIGWGTPGDFARCEKFAKIHGIPAHMRDGFCANLHKLATGEWPGKNAHKGMHALIAAAALDYLIAAAGTDTSRLIGWEGPLAQVGKPTGDRRRFPDNTLTYQSFPMPFRFQRVGLQGHQGAITVGVIKGASEQDVDAAKAADYGIEPGRYVWGNGYFLDPAVVPEVNEAVHLAEHGVAGPSVDLDSYTAVVKKNALSGETTADMVRGRQRAATLVAVPAFANLRIKITRPALTASIDFAVNATGWHGAPIAPREALFDADDAAKRIEGWANGDPKKMASMFLWIADSANAPLIGRKGYRLPWGDIVDGKPYLIYHAVYAAAALLQDAHGGLPSIPDEEKAKLRTVISSIYEDLAQQFNDPSIIAPWDRQAQTQQAAGVLAWNEFDDTDVDEYAYYVSCYTDALEEFVRTNWHHRYVERKHPRDPRHDRHAGEWIRTPQGPHGQIKVGSKWVYPPKRGEKGYKDPEGSARAIAKRGGGKPAGKTHVVKKASPDKGSRSEEHHRAHAPQAPRKAAPAARKAAPSRAKPDLEEHVGALKQMDRRDQKSYLHKLSDEEINGLVDKLGGKRLEDDTRDDLETEIIRRVNKDTNAEGKAKAKDEETRKKDKFIREISHGEGKKTTIAKKPTDKKPEPKPKPEPKTPAKKPTTSVGKKTKEYQPNPAQEKALKSLSEGGKAHPGSRRVLEREGYIDSEGKLTQKGRDHLGIKDEGTKKPETPAPAPKPTTSVGKKSPVAKKTTEEHVKALRELKTREEADKYLAEQKLTNAELRDIAKAQGKKPTSNMTKAQLTELVGRGARMKGYENTVKDTFNKPKAPAPPKKEHKLTDNQKAHLKWLRRGGKPGSLMEDKQARKILEREGFVDSKGNLTDKGRKAADEAIAAEPKPETPKLTPPKTVGIGEVNGKSPRPKRKLPDLPKHKDTQGPFRVKSQTPREAELEMLEADLKNSTINRDDWIEGWKRGLAEAEKSGNKSTIDYYRSNLEASYGRVDRLKRQIQEARTRPHDDVYDTPVDNPDVMVGTPDATQIDEHIKKIVDQDMPKMYHEQVHGQLGHQASFVPRSVASLQGVRFTDKGMFDQPGFEHTMAYYTINNRKMFFGPRWVSDALGTRASTHRSTASGWWVTPEDGTTPVENTLAHEFGHHVAYRAMESSRTKELLARIVENYDLPKDTPLTTSGIETALRGNVDKIRGSLSTYGAESLQEFLAEVWAEFTNGGSKTRPQAVSVGELMRELAEEAPVRT